VDDRRGVPACQRPIADILTAIVKKILNSGQYRERQSKLHAQDRPSDSEVPRGGIGVHVLVDDRRDGLDATGKSPTGMSAPTLCPFQKPRARVNEGMIGALGTRMTISSPL